MSIRKFITALTIAVATLTATATTPAWEEQKQDDTPQERMENEPIDITTRDGYVYISTPRAVTVKIFSILGQLISQEKIQAGTFRLRIANRGIYILKAGTITRRITI